MTEWRSFPSPTLGESVRCRLVRGTGDGPLPLVYLLHGRGDGAESWEPVIDDLRRLPLIAVMPDAPWSSRASYYVDSLHRSGRAVETAFTVDLLANVEDYLGTAVERRSRIIAGYSMGGYGALRLALAHASLFSTAVCLSPAVYTPEPPAGSSAREHGAFGRDDLLFDFERFNELNYPHLLAARPNNCNLTLTVAVGDSEPRHTGAVASASIAAQADALVFAAKRNPGIQATLRTYPGGHDFDVWRPALLDALGGIVSTSGPERIAPSTPARKSPGV